MASARRQERGNAIYPTGNTTDEWKAPTLKKRMNKFGRLLSQMNDDQIEEELRRRKLSTKGSSEILRTRLKNHEKASLAFGCENGLSMIVQRFRYLVVIDFEATCDPQAPAPYSHEIIEFPLVLIDTQQRRIIDRFQSFCRPVRNPILSDFCKRLTGITQEQVDAAPLFPEVLKNVEQWLSERNLLPSSNKDQVAFASDSPWDFARYLRFQCHLTGIPYPEMMKEWIDIHKDFARFYSTSRCGFRQMLKLLDLNLNGRHHSGLDDATNIAQIAIQMIEDGCIFSLNDGLRDNDPRYLAMIGESIPVEANDEDDGIIFADETDN